MDTNETLNRDQMKKVGKLNSYLRDKCGVPFSEAFPMAMLIVENWEGIKNIMEEDKISEEIK